MGRDQRLDFWRGLCLADMVLVHLAFEHLAFPWPWADVFGQYTRFAAGGFVFVAGFGVGMIFLPRAGGVWATRWPVYARLWRRAAFLLVVHYVAAAAFFALDVWRGLTPEPDAVSSACGAILTLRFMPHYGDILPLYVALLAVTPLLNEARRRVGWGPLAALSVTLVAVGQTHPWLLSVHTGENFPPVLWQVFFVAGLIFGYRFPAYRGAAQRYKVALCVASWAAFVPVFLSAYGPAFGLVRAAPLPLVFRKVPLSVGEIYWYFTAFLSVVLTTDVLWERWLARRACVGFVARLGRRSLPVYVGHVFAQAAVLELTWHGRLGTAAQMALLPADIGALWVLAWARDQGWGGWRNAALTALAPAARAVASAYRVIDFALRNVERPLARAAWPLVPVLTSAVVILGAIGRSGTEPLDPLLDMLVPIAQSVETSDAALAWPGGAPAVRDDAAAAERTLDTCPADQTGDGWLLVPPQDASAPEA